MGLFKKEVKYSNMVLQEIDLSFKKVSMNLEDLKTPKDIYQFVPRYNHAINALLDFAEKEKKYPYAPHFKNVKPAQMIAALEHDKPELERMMIDTWLHDLGRLLLNYTTEKGKQNNFDKNVAKFRYDYNQLDASSQSYFEQKLKELYPQYVGLRE